MNPFVPSARPLLAVLFALATTFAVSPAMADSLDTTSAASAGDAVDVHGLTKAQVEARFGAPEKRHAPVPAQGTRLNPPITRWDYDGFSVFFERDIAIHRVEHLKAAE